MGLEHLPDYRISANKNDITDTIKERLLSLRYTDCVGLESDTLEVALADNDTQKPILLPPMGAELELSIGYVGQLERVGLFVCDEMVLSGWPGNMTLRASAAPFKDSKNGMASLRSQKTRTWPDGTKLGNMLKKIANEHKMKASVSGELANISLPHLNQDESDIHFLLRVAKRYDAVVKPAEGMLVLAKAGSGKTASGAKMQSIRLTPKDVFSFSVRISSKESPGTVIAYWRDLETAQNIAVKVGDGEPVRKIKTAHPSKTMALASARAEFDRCARRGATLSLSLKGRPDIVAEARLILDGFRTGVVPEWVITRAEHSIDGSSYSTSVEAEMPNAS